VRPIVRNILQQKAFQETFNEQMEKITKARIPYKSKRQRQIEESAARKEAEGDTVRQVLAARSHITSHHITPCLITSDVVMLL
jgi:hypothetical protein